MHRGIVLRLVFALFLCIILLTSGALPSMGSPAAAETAAPTVTCSADALPVTVPANTVQPMATKTAAPAPSRAYTPIPTPVPTPAPAPTPAPDPWAGRFSREGAFLSIADPVKGPWVYKDETLSIAITVPKEGFMANRYLMADIYTRGSLPVGIVGTAGKGKKTTASMPYKLARDHSAVLAVTGDYITATCNKKGVMIRSGTVYFDKPNAPTLAFLPSGEMRMYEPGETTAEALLALGVKDSFAFGPILVKDGEMHKTVAKHKLNYHSFRAAIGQVEPGHFIIVVTRAPILLTDLAKIFIGLNCDIAYNLDGGYSAAMVFMGEQLNKNTGEAALQRPLPDLMMIGSNPAVPGPKDPVYCDGVNVHPRNKPKPTNGLLQ